MNFLGLLFATACLAVSPAVCAAGASKAEIAGVYVGSYAGGKASFELRADGTYTYSFVVSDMSAIAKKFAKAFHMQDGRVFSGSATWYTKDGKIRFWNLPSAFDFQEQGFPTIHVETLATWGAKNSRIVFSKRKDHWIQRVPK